jgi:hypothetical protein
VGPLPFLRTGPGIALDGKQKFDLSQFNQAYFERLRSRVAAAGERGIYVSVMLFEGWSVEQKGQLGNPWQGHPLNGANNVNGLDGDLNGDGQGKEIHTLAVPEQITELQRRYVREVIDTLNDLDNVLWEIGNEMHRGAVEWIYHMIDTIHEYEQTKPKQHPVGMTGAPIENEDLFNSPADWISPTGQDGYNDDPPVADGRKVIIADVDHVWPKDFAGWVWKSFTRGLNTAFMDMYGATSIGDKDVERDLKWTGDWIGQTETVRRNMGYTRRYAERMNLAAMTPRGDLCSTGYCLAEPGSAYLVYQPESGPVRLDLGVARGRRHSVEWLSPDTGEAVSAQAVGGGESVTLTPPFEGTAVLYLSSVSEPAA